MRLKELILLLGLSLCSLLMSQSTFGDEGSIPNTGNTKESLRISGIKSRNSNTILGGWSAYGGGPGGGQYSPLKQINIGNVDQLEVAWIYHTGDVAEGSAEKDPTTFEVNPILANGILYFCTPFNRVIALEPDTGHEIWTFDPKIDLANSTLGAHICRGVSYWANTETDNGKFCGKRIFEGTGDGRLIALDAGTGAPCTDFGVKGEVDLNSFDNGGNGVVGITSPPVVFENLVIVGGAFSSYKHSDAPNGIVRAFDAHTGKLVWDWNPIPEPKRPQVGGVNVWAPMSVDANRGLLFLPTTSPTVDPYGSARKTPIPFANSVVALDASRGEVVWHFQTVHHDLWDYDLPAQPMLIAVERRNRRIPVVVQVAKTGFIFVLDRETGEPIFPVKERPVPQSDVPGELSSPTQPFPTLPRPVTRQQLKPDEAWGLTFWDRGKCQERIAELRHEGLFTPPSLEGSVQIPNLSGGVNWGGAAFEPDRNWLVVNAINVAYSIKLFRREEFDPSKKVNRYTDMGEMVDTPYMWKSSPILSPFGIPCTPPPWGTLSTVDLKSGEILWQVPLGRISIGFLKTPKKWGSPNVGGPIVTAGGLVFIGATMESEFHAFDLATGKEMWNAELPAPGMATPMTYMSGSPPRQFVVIAAGGHAHVGTKLSDALVAFALPLVRVE